MARSVHNIKQRLALAGFIQKHYTESGLSDGQFAALAAKEFDFRVENHHVAYLRGELDIPVNAPKKPDPSTLIGRIEKLEQEMFEMRAKLGDLLK